MALCQASLTNALRWIFFKLLSISSYHMQIAQILRAPYRSRFLLRRSYRRKGVNSLFFHAAGGLVDLFFWPLKVAISCRKTVAWPDQQVVHVPGEDREKQLAKFLGEQDRMLGRWHFRETIIQSLFLVSNMFYVHPENMGKLFKKKRRA